jgi:hypothetical protein
MLAPLGATSGASNLVSGANMIQMSLLTELIVFFALIYKDAAPTEPNPLSGRSAIPLVSI